MPVWNPTDYSRHSSQQQKWAQELIAKLALKGNETVLDIGCGDGKVTAELAEHLPRGSVLGIDSSKAMVDFAKESFGNRNRRKLRFREKDARFLDYSQEFDLIFSNATLHWIWDHKPVLEGVFRALKPGGRMVIQMGGKGCAADVREVLDEMMAEPRWRQYFVGFTFQHGFHAPEEYRKWLKSAGLEPIRVELFPKDMTHAGANGLAGWLRTTWMPYIHAVTETLRGDFLDELVERFIAKHPLDADGNAHVAMVRLEVEAVRPAK